jgi:REP element-mobilizing transposase RayT
MFPRGVRRALGRSSIRCPVHDYAGWVWYFVTLCVARRQPLFGVLAPGSVDLSPLGRLVEERWRGIPARATRATTHELVVMPDHLHGILQVVPPPGYSLTPGERSFGPLQRQSLGLAMNLFKGDVTRIARQQGLLPDTTRLWLRGYHEQIIRDARHLANARAYIRDNPIRAAR